MKVLTGHVSRSSRSRKNEEYKERVVRLTDSLLSRDFWIYRNTCFRRSLTLYHLLQGVVPGIRICLGVRLKKDADGRSGRKRLQGHAWLMCGREIFPERDPDVGRTYTVTYCFPGKVAKTGDL